MTAPAVVASAISAAERRVMLAGNHDDRLAALADVDRALSDLDELRTRAAALLPIVDATAIYRPGGRSWYADLYARDVLADIHATARLDADTRMATARRTLERRDVTTSTLNGLVPDAYVSAGMVPAARSGRFVADLLAAPVPLPDLGAEVVLPRVSTAATVSAQSAENVVPTESNPATTPATASAVSYVAAVVDMSRQLIERATAEADVLIGIELRAALDAEIERQTIAGSGASGELAGLLAVSGATTTTATNPADSTAAALLAVMAKHFAAVAATGQLPDAWIMAPRRLAWIMAKATAATFPGWPFTDPLPSDPAGTACRFLHRPVIVSTGVPLDRGAGSNEDRIVTVRRGDAWLLEGAPTVRFDPLDVATVRVTVAAYAVLAHMRPSAVGIMDGTTLAQAL